MRRLTGRAIFFATMLAISANGAIAMPEAVPGEFVIKMRVDVDENKSTLQALSDELGSYVKGAIPAYRVVVVQRPVFEITESAMKVLSQSDLVEYVEPNYIYRANKAPNDPRYFELWGMNNNSKPGIDIGAEAAWDITTGHRDVVVAVIDTGINYNHPDLQANMWTNDAELNGVAGVDDDGNGVVDDIYGYNAINDSGDPLDDHGHGSHCAGTIGARGDDSIGVAGVAWNVRLMGVKFLSASGSGTLADAVKAIDYATRMGAKVLSNSWGGGGFSQTLMDAIERSNAAGSLFVAAAGNESNNNDANPTYPATYDVQNVVSVAAINNQGNLASFSNYGKSKVHVAAPGVGILSSINTDGYDSWDGTSMAAPHVSGIAALLLSENPTMTGVELKERIVSTARPFASLRGKVKTGIANAHAALTNDVPPPDPNDPANWSTMPLSISSEHPYKNSINKEVYKVSVPGAKEFALYFSKFDTERNYDWVVIKDSKNKQVERLSGRLDDSFSAIITGDSATIEFSSDSSINGYGWDITKAAFR